MELDVAQTGCSCGKAHKVSIENIHVEQGLLSRLGELVTQLNLGKRALIYADNNTYQAAGSQVEQELTAARIKVDRLIFQRKGELVADEYALGEAILALENGPDFLISVGSGTITDITRYIASIHKVPFVEVPTAPSMDGYASSVAPVIQHGAKKTFPACSPYAIFVDLDVLRKCPPRMIQAGLGDLLGKITSKADWQLSRLLNNEYYCPEVQSVVDRAVEMTMHNVKNDRLETPEFLRELANGLILSGIAISMVGNSRPASGAEHHMSHYWEMLGLKEQREIPLHGQKVGYATWLILRVYEKVIARVMKGEDKTLQQVFQQVANSLISSDEYLALLKQAKAATTYQELDLPRQWVDSALRQALNVRERYTVLRFAEAKGWLSSIADELMEEI